MITVVIKANGYLKKYFAGGESYDVELEDGATVGDLYDKIDTLYGDGWSSSIWSRDRKNFRKPMVVRLSGDCKFNSDRKLQDGDVLSVTRVIVGG